MKTYVTKKNEKLLRSKLYFLNHPRDLKYEDIYRHICRECRRVFHFPTGLEWHICDVHPTLLEQYKKDLVWSNERKHWEKRKLPERSAAPRGAKRWKLSLESDLLESRTIKAEKKDVDSYIDIDFLLESSEEEQEDDMPAKILVSDVKIVVQKVNLCSKECMVELERISVIHDTADLNNNLISKGSDSDIVMESNPGDSDEDIEVLSNSADKKSNSIISPEVINLSLSSKNLSSQPSQWSAPEDTESSKELARLPRLSIAKDKVLWWLATAGLGGHRLYNVDNNMESILRVSKKAMRKQDCD